MNILHTHRRIGLALMLAGALALPVATPVDAAAQNRPGQYLEKGGNGKGKQAQKQQAQRGQKANKGNKGKVREQGQRAQRAENRAQRQQKQANRAQHQARQAQERAHRARQNERRVEQQARRQHQQVRQAERNARQAQVRAAEQRAQARAARERAEARAYRVQQQRVQQQRIHQQRVHQQRIQQQRIQHQRIQQRVHQHRAPVRRQSVGGRHYHPFYASPIYVQRYRPQYRNNVFAVDGYLQDDGYQCVQLRDDQGNPYILEGRVEGLFAGDHVRLVAREAPFSSCGGYGRPVIVTRVVRVWADSHHRSAYFQVNIDGGFDNWARWRRGDDWLREPRFYDPYNDGYTGDYYYDGYHYDQDDYAYYDEGW